jgi:NADPH2:quinone reductase
MCRCFGPPETLGVAEVPSPVRRPGEVSVRMKAARVDLSDSLIIRGTSQLKPPLFSRVAYARSEDQVTGGKQ